MFVFMCCNLLLTFPSTLRVNIEVVSRQQSVSRKRTVDRYSHKDFYDEKRREGHLPRVCEQKWKEACLSGSGWRVRVIAGKKVYREN